MSAFSTVVESHLKDLTSSDLSYIGYVDGEDGLQKFMDDMRASGYMFVNRSSNKGNKAYFFQRNGKNHTFQIHFFGPLFQINKNSLYECSQGKTKNRSRISSKDNCEKNEDYVPPLKKRMKDQSSKKIGCEASMHILELRIFPDFTIEEYVPKGSSVQSNLVRRLKDEVKKSPGPNSMVRFMIKVSQETVHNHTVESSTKTLNLHPKLIEEIKSITKQRMCSVKEVKSHLKEYVEKTFIRENNTAPDVNNTCFYPTEKVIHFHMHKDKSSSSLFYHQDGLMNLVGDWSMLVPDNMFMLRLCSDIIYKQEDSDTEQNQTFLFCHQTSWQKQLLQRYGNCICHLETGVHKGGRDSFMKRIPLYFLSVKTNVGFTCVAWFIIQEQSSDLLQEALSVILSCNSEWRPQYFLTNCSGIDVDAVQKLFPSTVVFYSPFHREQLWSRWLKVKDNVTSLRSERNIMALWKDVAQSSSETELETNLNVMKSDESYVSNQKAQDYFSDNWLHEDIFHLWIEAYQTEDFLSMMYTSNGMEMQCKAISYKATTLTDLAKFVYEDHLPRVFQKYCQSNTVDISSYTFPDCDFLPILELLKDRPARFINHVVNHYSTAVHNYNVNNVTLQDDGSTFSVTNDFGGGLEGPFIVKLGDPTCSCPDFAKWRFPCEHMCAIFAHVPEGTLEQLPSSYLDSPYLTLDNQFGEFYFTETEYDVAVFEDSEQVEKIESRECIIDYNSEYVLVNECSSQSEIADVESMADTVEILGLPLGSAYKESLVSESQVVGKVQADFRTQLVKVHNMSYLANDVVCLEEGISILNSFEGKIVAQVDHCA